MVKDTSHIQRSVTSRCFCTGLAREALNPIDRPRKHGLLSVEQFRARASVSPTLQQLQSSQGTTVHAKPFSEQIEPRNCSPQSAKRNACRDTKNKHQPCRRHAESAKESRPPLSTLGPHVPSRVFSFLHDACRVASSRRKWHEKEWGPPKPLGSRAARR